MQIDWPAERVRQPSLVAQPRRARPRRWRTSSWTISPTRSRRGGVAGLAGRRADLPHAGARRRQLRQPTLTLTDKHLILGLNPPECAPPPPARKRRHAELHRERGLQDGRGDRGKAQPRLRLSGQPRRFSSGSTARSSRWRMFGAAFAVPQVGEYVDLGKLPDAEDDLQAPFADRPLRIESTTRASCWNRSARSRSVRRSVIVPGDRRGRRGAHVRKHRRAPESARPDSPGDAHAFHAPPQTGTDE